MFGEHVHGDYELVKLLLEHGHRATPIYLCHGPSAISCTIRGELASIEMLKLLFEHGYNLKGSGADIEAADEGNLEALKLLLNHGLDLEEQNMCGYPFDEDRDETYESRGIALYRACRQGWVECMELLLDRVADPRTEDDGGVSCIEIAKNRGHQDVVKLLVKEE